MGTVSEDSARPLGEWLRKRREELGISLEQAQVDTRIRARYLQALESEEFAALPDLIVGRGFLRNYAAYLKLDPREAVGRLSTGGAPPEPEAVLSDGSNPFTTGPFQPVPLHEMPSLGSRRAWLFGALAILVVALGVIAWWGIPRIPQIWSWIKPGDGASAIAPTKKATGVSLPTATRTPLMASAAAPASVTPTRSAPTATLTLTFTPSPSFTPSPPVYTGIFLELVFTNTSWIQVTVDSVRQEQGELPQGTYRSYYGKERIELRIGNAGSVTVTVNGENLGALGAPGEVVDRVFEIAGGQVNEATFTPQPIGTLTPEATVKPTIEPTATATVRPGATLGTPEVSPTVPVTATTTVIATPTP